MRTITGTVRSTATQWLPVLSHIDPPEVRRQRSSQSIVDKIKRKDNLPIYIDIVHHPIKRLKSRHPIWEEATTEVDPLVEWKRTWQESELQNTSMIEDPTAKVPGFDLPRGVWTTLNRIRTEQGKCNYLLHKWGMAESPLCKCGLLQTVRHIVNECPITKYMGDTEDIHKASNKAIKWMENLCVRL